MDLSGDSYSLTKNVLEICEWVSGLPEDAISTHKQGP